MVFVKKNLKNSLKNMHQLISNKCIEISELLENYAIDKTNKKDVYLMIDTIHTMIYIMVQTLKDKHASFDLYSQYKNLDRLKFKKCKIMAVVDNFTKGCFKTIILLLNLFIRGLCDIMVNEKLKEKDNTFTYIDSVRNIWSCYMNEKYNESEIKLYIQNEFVKLFEILLYELETTQKQISDIKVLLGINSDNINAIKEQ